MRDNGGYRRVASTTREIVQWLVQRDYDEIEKRTDRVRLSAVELRNAVDEYGRRLLMPPDVAFDELDVVEIDTKGGARAWSVRVDLWTEEEGRSDLSLEMTMREPNEDDGGGQLVVEVDNLHVL